MATTEKRAIGSEEQLHSEILKNLNASRGVSRQLVVLEDSSIATILNHLADLVLAHSDGLMEANRKDLVRMDVSDPKYDRLLLTPKRLQDIARDLRAVASLPSPLNREMEVKKLDNGLQLRKISVPLGVVAVIFESRPNVTFDVFALCLKSGNASVLKGSRDAHFSNLAILSLIREALATYALEHACYLAPSERDALLPILHAVGYIDVAIPRGSQGLIDYVRKHAKIPVIETGAGIVHTYYDASGDFEKAYAIIENAKSRRVSVCNALDTLLIHRDKLQELPELLQRLGQVHRCEIFADEPAFSVLAQAYPSDLLHRAQADSYGTEFLSMKISVKTVSNLQEALDHIDQFSSKHSEAIIAEDQAILEQFMRRVDAAVVYTNTSTAFTDGQEFGMGAEIGISTQKLHARGPMALSELTSYKWLVQGNGQTRR